MKGPQLQKGKNMSPLKQSICKVSFIGHELAQQMTGDDLSDLAKAQLLDKLFHNVKEMLGHAVDELEVPEQTFIFLKRHINAMDEDAELAVVIRKLEEATDEPEDNKEHSTMNGIGTGCKPYVH